MTVVTWLLWSLVSLKGSQLCGVKSDGCNKCLFVLLADYSCETETSDDVLIDM